MARKFILLSHLFGLNVKLEACPVNTPSLLLDGLQVGIEVLNRVSICYLHIFGGALEEIRMRVLEELFKLGFAHSSGFECRLEGGEAPSQGSWQHFY